MAIYNSLLSISDTTMNLIDFDQYFYRTPEVESVTTGGNFELVNLNDEEKRRAEEFVQVVFPLAGAPSHYNVLFAL